MLGELPTGDTGLSSIVCGNVVLQHIAGIALPARQHLLASMLFAGGNLFTSGAVRVDGISTFTLLTTGIACTFYRQASSGGVVFNNCRGNTIFRGCAVESLLQIESL